MLFRTLVLIALATSLGCTAHESDETSKPAPRTTKTDPKPEPEPEPQAEPEPEPEPEQVLAKASISSVTMIQDCPDQPPPKPKPSAATEARDEPPADQPAPPEATEMKRSAAEVAPGAALARSAHGWTPPCDQSTVQIAFTGQGDAPGHVMIERVRLLEPGSFEELARLSLRHPATWTDQGYFAWDETIPAGGSVKASYSSSLPNWNDVERKKSGASAIGHMFVLEVEVSIDGVSQTIRSQQFPREEAHVVVT